MAMDFSRRVKEYRPLNLEGPVLFCSKVRDSGFSGYMRIQIYAAMPVQAFNCTTPVFHTVLASTFRYMEQTIHCNCRSAF